MAIVRVEVHESMLLPDEDFIARQIKRQGIQPLCRMDIRKLTEWVDPRNFRSAWKDCLRICGKVASLPVPPHAVTGSVVIPRERMDLAFGLGGDCVPYDLHYSLIGSKVYDQAMPVLFENGPEEAAQQVRNALFPPELMQALPQPVKAVQTA
jgi:hypothetical protein